MATSTVPLRTLSPEDVAAYHRDGFLIVAGLYSGDHMLEWKRTMQELIAQEPENRSGVRVWSPTSIHPMLLEAMRDAYITPVLQQLVGPDLEFLSAKAVFKNSTTVFKSPWHQDWFYWNGANKTSVWIALDDATPANGCLKFVPGSHKKVFDLKIVEDGNAFSHRVSDDDVKDWPEATIAVKRGDAVVFHDLAVHSSYPNTSGADRWSLISTYRNAAVKDECGLNANLWNQPMLISGTSVNDGIAY